MSNKIKNPVGKLREKQKAETYELILESSRFLFETKGFEKTTIRDIASNAEIALGTTYKHFRNKTSILAAAFYDDLVKLFEKAKTSVPGNGSIQDKFIHFAGLNYKYYMSRPALSREYLNNIALADKEWLERIESFEKRYLEEVKFLISSAIEKGEIDSDKDCDFIAHSFMADYFYVLWNLFLKQRIDDPEEMLFFLKKMLDQIVL